MRLEKKIAFVTGAGGGIGQAICQRFLGEGALVAAVDVDLSAAVAAATASGRDGGHAMPIQCDVSDADSVRNAIARTVEAFGGLHVLCNVAGGSTAADAAVTDAPEAEFWRAIRLDLFGTFLCCKYAIPEMIRSGGGSIINMASMVALTPVRGRDCYTAAKGGVVSLTRSMALEYAPQRIRVNAIAPGITRTPRVMALVEGSAAMEPIAAAHLLGLVEPVEVAHMAVYLASEESRTVTGQVYAVDSGVTMR